MDVLTSTILPFLGVLIVLVVVHEFGHFITAKLFGVKVLEFGVGFPPRLFTIKRTAETEYTVNALPLGGFVRLLGEEDPSDPRSLAAQPAISRLVIMGAGSFMNFVLAITLFSVALMIPRELPAGQAVISQVVPGSPAAEAGLKRGDIIEKIGGREIDSIGDVSYNILLNKGEQTEIEVRRTNLQGDPEAFRTMVRPRWAPKPYEYVVEPGQDVNAVAAATTFDRDAVRQAAGIETLLPARRIVPMLLAVLLGSILYRLAVALALELRVFGVEASDLNLLTAVLVAGALLLPGLRRRLVAGPAGSRG